MILEVLISCMHQSDFSLISKTGITGNALLIVSHICRYWQEQGWFTSYGKAFGNWLYEFFIYDIHRPDVKNGQQHLKALKELTQAYGFSEQIRSSKLWRELSRV